MLLVGDAFVRLIPVPLLAGLLLFVGVALLDEWLVKSRRRLSGRPPEIAFLAAAFAVALAGVSW